MKIAIYSHSIAPSIDGVCRRFTGILKQLEKDGHDTLLFTMEECPEELPISTKYVTLDHIIFPSYPEKKVAWPTASSFAKILFHLQSFRPEVVHIVSDGFSQMFTLAGLLLGIPVVGSFHTDILDLLGTHGAYGVQKLCVFSKEALDSIVLDSCATTSTSFQKKLRGQWVHCEHVIITAVDTANFDPSKRNEELRKKLMHGDETGFLCLYVGRISNEKRLDIMIDAINGLNDNGRKAYLAIIGAGPAADHFKKMHQNPSVCKGRIYCQPEFVSHETLGQYYASSDVHVSASQFETLGNTVLEAFACDVPVVVPDTQGFKDTVSHGKDGFLFEPGDSDSANKFLQQLKDDKLLQAKMGHAGLEKVRARSIENVVKDLFEWYAVGKTRRKQRSFIAFLLCTLALAASVPFTIFLFSLYNITVNYILKAIPLINLNSEYKVNQSKKYK